MAVYMIKQLQFLIQHKLTFDIIDMFIIFNNGTKNINFGQIEKTFSHML